MSDRTGLMQDGFRRKLNKRIRKPASNTSGFPWVNSPEGRVMKIIIGFVGDQMVHGANLIMTRDFKGNGITGHRLLSGLETICPWAKSLYLEIRGQKLTEEIVYDRFHKMYYRNGIPGAGGKPKMSEEHYSHSPKLKPYVEGVRKVWISGQTITLEEAWKLGSLR